MGGGQWEWSGTEMKHLGFHLLIYNMDGLGLKCCKYGPLWAELSTCTGFIIPAGTRVWVS